MAMLADYHLVKTRFHRSVDLLQDVGRSDALDGYILTSQAAELAKRVADGLTPASLERAWTITGPYGTGKSAFALYLNTLLSGPNNAAYPVAIDRLRTTSGDTVARTVAAVFKKQTRGYLTVLVSGAREAFVPALLQSLANAVKAYFGVKAKGRDLVQEIDALKRRRNGGLDEALCLLLGRISKEVTVTNGLGLVIIVDELGKFLEFAAANPDRGDIFVLQRIAERAVRSSDAPFSIITILHQAFERYSASLPAATRDEWRKIQGRFQDAAFIEDPRQLIRLIGSAITHKKRAEGERKKQYDAVLVEASRQRVYTDEDAASFYHAFPLHPMATAILPPVFRSALAQNERSLFSFLAAKHQHGFTGYLEQTPAIHGPDALYRIDRVYDYLKDTMGPALLGLSDSKRWAEIENAIGRVPSDASPLATKVVKVIGALALFGSPSVRASRSLIALALEDGAEPSTELSQAIEQLEKASIVVFRRHRDAYALWEGSDVNLDERFTSARERVLGTTGLLSAIRRRAQLHSMVARRHFFTTGTIRYFEVAATITAALETAAALPANGGDGRVLYLMASAEESFSDLCAAAARATKHYERPGLVLVAVPHNGAEILAAASDLEAWVDVRQTTAELAGDAVARRELAARIATAEDRLDTALGKAFGWGDRDATTHAAWFWKGVELPGLTPRTLSELLSTVFDQAYDKAPTIHHELLNRRILSSAAASARRTLIDRMLAEPGKEGLGIEGFPPEMSMYASILKDSGLHRSDSSGRWAFGPPKPAADHPFSPTWQAINDFLEATDGARKPLSELRKLLSSPPFGIKDGPFPVLLFATIQSSPGEIALFEEGTFQPEITGAVIERLLRRTEHFEIARYRLDRGRIEALAMITHALKLAESSARAVDAVRTIVRRVSVLPKYTRSTRRLTGGALAAREAVLAAHDPLQLLFRDLPTALGVEPIDKGMGAKAKEAGALYVARLVQGFQELESAFPNLINEIQRHFSVALDVGGDGDAFRDELTERAKRIERLTTDTRLRSFVLRLLDKTLPFNEWIESAAMVVINRPPSEWGDPDLTKFEIGLTELRALFFRAEELAIDQQTMEVAGGGVVELLRVSLASPGRKEARQLLRLRQSDAPKLAQAQSEIVQLLEKRFGKQRRDTWLAALGRLMQDLVESRDATDAATMGDKAKKS